MHRTLILAILCGCLPTAALADPCDVQTAEMVEATGATFVRRSPSGDNVFLRHPLAESFMLSCRDRIGVGPGHISLNVETAYPPNDFFDLIGKAASSSLKVPAAEAGRLAMRCHKTAPADRDELSQADSKAIHVECQSFRRDGGGTIVSVWPPNPR